LHDHLPISGVLKKITPAAFLRGAAKLWNRSQPIPRHKRRRARRRTLGIGDRFQHMGMQ